MVAMPAKKPRVPRAVFPNDTKSLASESAAVSGTIEPTKALGRPALVGRTEAARALGCSVSTFIRRIEPNLQAVVDARGWRFFPVEQIEQIKTTTVVTRVSRGASVDDDGQIDRDTYQQVLDAFDKGEALVDVAKRLSLYIEEVEPIFEKWKRYRKAYFLSDDQLNELWDNIERHYGLGRPKRDNPADLMRVVLKMAAELDVSEPARACRGCRSVEKQLFRPAVYCVYCAEDRFGRRRKS